MAIHNKIDWPVEQMRKWYEIDGMTCQQIADLLGRSQKAVNKACKRLGFRMRRTGPKSGPGHPDWKGGRFADKHGYILVWNPEHPAANSGGYVREHRLVMEKILGRFLTKKEVVHHRDDNPANNDPDNLELYATNADHLRATLAGKTPNWTPEGRRRTLDGARMRRKPGDQG